MSVANLNGASIYYAVKGQGIPIVFVHPPTLSSRMFSHQMDQLSTIFQTITFDIPGHGKSSASQAPVTYRTIANDMNLLLDTLKLEKVFLCGYSTGGSAILEFLLRYPERAQGAILIGAMSEVHDLRLKFRILLGVTFAKMNAIKPLALSITWSNSDNLRLFWTCYREANKGDARNIKEYYQSSLTYNCTDQLARIHQPVLLVYGEKDKGFHSYARLLYTRLPNSTLVYIQQVKHQIPTRAFRELHRLIVDFVDKHKLSGKAQT